MENSNITFFDKILSFFLGIVVVTIFFKMFDTPCIVIKGPHPSKLPNVIMTGKYGCHKLKLKKSSCSCLQ